MIYEKLIEKSKEAFVMAIEIYNKPTIKYRVEIGRASCRERVSA